MAAWCGGCRFETCAGYCPQGLGRAGEGVARQSGGWECLKFDVTVRCISGQWRSLSLALSLSLTHKLLFTHTLTHFPIIHPPTHSISNSLTLFLSLSLSLLLSLVFALAFSHRLSFSGFLSVFLFLQYTYTRAHAVIRSLSSTHSQTHARTKSLCPFFLHTHTHFSIFLSLSLSLSLFLSYNTHTLIHTHIRTHTPSHLWTRSSTHSLLSRVRAALSSARVRARALFSLFLSPFLPFLIVSFPILSLLFSSSPLGGLLPRRLCLTRSLPDFSTPGNYDSIWNSQTLTASAFFHSLARGIFSQMERWRRRIQGKTSWWERIGISLYPRQNFLTYYRTRLTVVAYYKLATLRFVAYYKRFSLITGSCLSCIYMYIYIFICVYIYIYT